MERVQNELFCVKGTVLAFPLVNRTHTHSTSQTHSAIILTILGVTLPGVGAIHKLIQVFTSSDICGDTQNLTCHIPRQPGLSDPA